MKYIFTSSITTFVAMHSLALFFIYFSQLFNISKTYENLALNKPAWQQHPHSTYTEWGADLAVDGRYSYLDSSIRQCALSDIGKSTAEWRVDLKGVHSIHHIFIYYWESVGYITTFLGFSLYISNTTSKEDGILCFRDTIYTEKTIPNPLNISCRLNGKFVIYYNNRTHPPFPPDYSSDAYNDLCEIEVYGCPNASYFGENCSTPCHQNCLEDRCDIVDETCLGCIPGYTGTTCYTGCIRNYKKIISTKNTHIYNIDNFIFNNSVYFNFILKTKEQVILNL